MNLADLIAHHRKGLETAQRQIAAYTATPSAVDLTKKLFYWNKQIDLHTFAVSFLESQT
jgi:hypothetical protein